MAVRAEKAAKEAAAAAPPRSSTPPLSTSSGSTGSIGSGHTRSATGDKPPSSIAALLSAFNQQGNGTTASGSSSTPSSASPTPPSSVKVSATAPATAKSTTLAAATSTPKTAASSPITRTVPPRPASASNEPTTSANLAVSSGSDTKPSTTKPPTSVTTNSATSSTTLTAKTTAATTTANPVAKSSAATGIVASSSGSSIAASSSSTSLSSNTAAVSASKTANGDLVVNGGWSIPDRTAGASPNTSHWRRNPQFSIAIGPGGGDVKICLSQKPKDPLPFLAFYIFKAQDNRRVMDMKEKIYAPEHFLNKELIETTCHFPEGLFSIMCATFQPETTDFTLTVSGGSCVQSLRPVTDYIVSEITGAWAKPLAGGCMNHPTWRSNPKYSITVTESSTKTKIIGVLITQSEPSLGAGFYVFAASNQNVPVAKSGFTTVSVCHEFSLAAGEYVLVPATYEFGKEAPFEISLHSNYPITFAPLSS